MSYREQGRILPERYPIDAASHKNLFLTRHMHALRAEAASMPGDPLPKGLPHPRPAGLQNISETTIR